MKFESGTGTKTETYNYDSNGRFIGITYDTGSLLSNPLTQTGDYDALGMPGTLFGRKVKWTRGTMLSEAGTSTISYDENGMRYKQSSMGGATYYYYDGDRLVAEKSVSTIPVTPTLTQYYYNETGVIGMNYKGADYYYGKTPLGDIRYVYDTAGTVVAEYAYDAWGNCTIVKNVNKIANANPFRYRGYYLDTTTNLYYLQTRYYSPVIRRFISPDNYELLPTLAQSMGEMNMYAYCANNPVMYTDSTGTMADWLKWTIGAVVVVGLVVATAATFGAFGPAAVAIGAAVLTGGLVSAGINVGMQLSSGGSFDWGELAISALSGMAYGLVFATTGGAGAVFGKLAVAGGTSLLNSWNKELGFKDTMVNLGASLAMSVAFQGGGKLVGGLLGKIPSNPQMWVTLGDIGKTLWEIPAVQTGAILAGSGIFKWIRSVA